MGRSGASGKTLSWDVEAVERDLNRLVESRATGAKLANERVRHEAQMLQSYHLRAAAERREQWITFHRDLARLHGSLADEHRREAAALAAGGGGIR